MICLAKCKVALEGQLDGRPSILPPRGVIKKRTDIDDNLADETPNTRHPMDKLDLAVASMCATQTYLQQK